MKLVPSSKIYVAESRIAQGGRGVFAAQRIKKDEFIERCPVVVIKPEDVPLLRQTDLLNYYFRWGDGKAHHRGAISLGYGALYNHSYTPNATYTKNYEESTIEFIALNDIGLNEEITVNYNDGNPLDRSPLWMKDVPTATEQA